MTLPGVDVSSYNVAPGSWKAVAGDIRWAAVKLTEVAADDTYVNPDAKADWDWLKSTGKGRVAYLFAHPDVSADTTVTRFTAELHSLGLEDGDAVAVDLEVTGGLGPAAVDAWALDVLRQLDSQLERTPLLYSFIAFIGAGNCASLSGYPLWLADPSAPAGHPSVPAPWKSCAIQQTVITGPIDRDVAFYPGLAAMRAALGKRGAKPGKVIHWHTLGLWSLAREAQAHDTTPGEMLTLAAAAGHKYGAAMRAYVARGNWNARLPAGTELFAPAD